MNEIIYKIKKNGLMYCISRYIKKIWSTKIDLIICYLLYIFFKNKPLRDIILIESHNDFDSNGGAIYEYLINKNYNEKYKIVLLIKNWNVRPKIMPKNVTMVPYFSPNILKDYYYLNAKYFTFDNTIVRKIRKDQKFYFLTHGAVGYKKCDCPIPEWIDYILMPSKNMAPYALINYKLTYPDERLIYVGYPVQDYLYKKYDDEILKLFNKRINEKIIFWMPTFRKDKNSKRNDSTYEMKIGIPLLQSIYEFNQLNNYLKTKGIILIIKLHPYQDLSQLIISDLSNIKILTNDKLKSKNLNIYKLLSNASALISDYSSIAIDFMHCNKPIAYVLNDKDSYVGFTSKDTEKLYVGDIIDNLNDMYDFIDKISKNIDTYKDIRNELFNQIYLYHDSKSCERLVDFMGL